jgi:hypothetical protein
MTRSSTVAASSTESEVTIAGSFAKSSYTLELGETLNVKVNASAENANLTRVTVTVDGSGDDDHDHEDISGTDWSGYLTLDSNVYPLDTPGTYTIKLFAKRRIKCWRTCNNLFGILVHKNL